MSLRSQDNNFEWIHKPKKLYISLYQFPAKLRSCLIIDSIALKLQDNIFEYLKTSWSQIVAVHPPSGCWVSAFIKRLKHHWMATIGGRGRVAPENLPRIPPGSRAKVKSWRTLLFFSSHGLKWMYWWHLVQLAVSREGLGQSDWKGRNYKCLL